MTDDPKPSQPVNRPDGGGASQQVRTPRPDGGSTEQAVKNLPRPDGGRVTQASEGYVQDDSSTTLLQE
jgi:hypothetical protein